jgi:hypothetical protein
VEFKDLITLYFERSNALETLWTIYITVVVGLLAFLGSVKLRPPRRLVVGTLILAFAGFAWFNCDALRSVTRQRVAAAGLIRDLQRSKPNDAQVEKLANTLDPSSEREVTASHAAVDAVAVAAFLMLASRKKAKKEPAGKAATAVAK